MFRENDSICHNNSVRLRISRASRSPHNADRVSSTAKTSNTVTTTTTCDAPATPPLRAHARALALCQVRAES